MSVFLQNVPKLSKRLALVEGSVLLPGTNIKFFISDPRIELILPANLKTHHQNIIFGVVNVAEVGNIGTAAIIQESFPNSFNVVGLCRFRIEKIIKREPKIIAEIIQLDSHTNCSELYKNPKVKELSDKLIDCISIFLSNDNTKIINFISNYFQKNIHVCYLSEICASFIGLSNNGKLKILNTEDIVEKMEITLSLMLQRTKDMHNKQNILKLSRNMQPLIITSLGSGKRMSSDLVQLENRLKQIKFPPNVQKTIDRDFQSLLKISTFNPEYNVLSSYLNLIVELPWDKIAEENLDLHKSKLDLEADHYGLESVKKRILEYLAVKKLRSMSDNTYNAPVLCLVGPPGVGKTSIAKSIAFTLNRPFEKVSLGGINNMTDIRGHKRTYVSAMPGRILQAIKRAAVRNPVILLDEIDKMVKTSGLHGNPEAALLEVLDPYQNREFLDHYLNIPFDISQILFIATANDMRKLSPALLDRLEIIKIGAYTYLEKIQIAINYLIPKQLLENGLSTDQIKIPEKTLHVLINHYTREAGVRDLERKIGSICRAVALQFALKKNIENVEPAANEPIIINVNAVKEILGPLKYESRWWTSRLEKPGVAIGLVAISSLGGDILAIESSFMPGDGQLRLTGSLGDILKESAELAWVWVKSNAHLYGVDLNGERLKKIDVHIHFPEGAIEKDGPSAGVTIASALMSLFLDRRILPNIAMTGEITLQGLVLPVGAIKEKVIAAHKYGFTKIIIPKLNANHLHEIPAHIKDEITFIFVTDMHSIIEKVFDNGEDVLVPVLKSKL